MKIRNSNDYSNFRNKLTDIIDKYCIATPTTKLQLESDLSNCEKGKYCLIDKIAKFFHFEYGRKGISPKDLQRELGTNVLIPSITRVNTQFEKIIDEWVQSI